MKISSAACMLMCLVTLKVASADESSCDVVPIKQWSGSSSWFVQELTTPVDLVVVTHTMTAACDTDDACASICKSIRNNDMQYGFEDISLSFLVGGNGKIYEGAGWKIGRHTVGYDERSISLSFIGDFSDSVPTDAALKAAEQFLTCYVNTQYLATEYKLVGQRQLVSTTSPGDALQNYIQNLTHWTESDKSFRSIRENSVRRSSPR